MRSDLIQMSAAAGDFAAFYYDGQVARGLDTLFAHLNEAGFAPWLAVSSINLTVSLVDKVLTGAIGFLLARLIWTLPGAAEQGLAPPRLLTGRRR